MEAQQDKLVITYPSTFDGELHVNAKRQGGMYNFDFSYTATGSASSWESLDKAAQDILEEDQRQKKEGTMSKTKEQPLVCTRCLKMEVSSERPTLIVILSDESEFIGYYLKRTSLSEDEKRLLEFCLELSNKDVHRAKMAMLLVETGQPSSGRRYESDNYADLAGELLGNPDYDPTRGEGWTALSKSDHNGLDAVVYHFDGEIW